MSNKQFRKITRFIHIFAGSVLGVYVYSPLGSEPTFQAFTQFLIFPLILTATGITLWQQPVILKFLKKNHQKPTQKYDSSKSSTTFRTAEALSQINKE
jgi:hypothetical protein